MNRRELIVGAAGVAALSQLAGAENKRMGKLWVFVGTNTNSGKSEGIYRFELDPETGRATEPVLAARTANPTWVALHPNGRFLYSVNAIADFQGGKTGSVSAFALDPRTGSLTLLNQQPSMGPGPCHLAVDRAGKHVLVANYVGGSIAVLPLGADGKLQPPSCAIQHTGTGKDPKRQEGPHAHSINLDAAERFAFVADLGLDRILVYRFDPSQGKLTPHEPAFASTRAGAGPRHFTFHPSGKFAYVINELDSTLTAFRYDGAAGTLTEIQAITTLPEGFTAENYTAEVRVLSSGKFLYGSNRGHDSLAIYRIDPETGRLTFTAHLPTAGKWPRNFAPDPSERWMVVGNQDSHTVRIYRINGETGALDWTGQELSCPVPICFRMLPQAA